MKQIPGFRKKKKSRRKQLSTPDVRPLYHFAPKSAASRGSSYQRCSAPEITFTALIYQMDKPMHVKVDYVTSTYKSSFNKKSRIS